MTAAHTPGPWKNHGRQVADRGLPHSAVAAKTLLARVYSEAFGDTKQETANANLIAAAPDLLAALVALVPADFDEHPGDFAPEWHAARAAIAKATGSAP